MKELDWNEMSELGLIRIINEEVLHPLGLAMSRNPTTGTSDVILISDDGIWEYKDKQPRPSQQELKQKISDLIEKKFGQQ